MIAQLRQTGGRNTYTLRQSLTLLITPLPVGVFLTLCFGFVTHYLGMEAISVASACYGFIALAGAMCLLRRRNKRRSIENIPQPNETDGHRRAVEREEAWYGRALASFADRREGINASMLRTMLFSQGKMGQQQAYVPKKDAASWLLREMRGVSLIVFGSDNPDDVRTLVLDVSIREDIIESADLRERLKACVEKVLAAGYPCLGLVNFPWKSQGPQDFEAVLFPEISDPRNAERVLMICAYEFRRKCVVIPLGPEILIKRTDVFYSGR
jgi:hypothetical protein